MRAIKLLIMLVVVVGSIAWLSGCEYRRSEIPHGTPDETVEFLITSNGESDDLVGAVALLGEDGTASVPAIRKGLERRLSSDKRYLLIMALGRNNTPAATRELRGLLGDEAAPMAAYLLAFRGDDSGRRILQSASTAKATFWLDRQGAREALDALERLPAGVEDAQD